MVLNHSRQFCWYMVCSSCFPPEAGKFLRQPFGCRHFNTIAGHLIRSAAHAALGCGMPDEILSGIYPPLCIGVFFPNVLTCLLTIMDSSVSFEAAGGCFDVLEQVIDLHVHTGIGRAGVKGDTQCQDGGEDCCKPAVNSWVPVHQPI